MMGFHHDQNPYRAMFPTPETDGILYGLAIEEQLLATPVAPSPAATTLADAATPELTSPDLPPTASAQSARSASFSFATPTATSSGSFSVAPSARSASFCLPAGSGSSPSLAELFMRGPSAEQNALQNYLNNLATNNTSVGGEASGGSKRKRKNEDKDKKKRKRRSEERTKKTAERTKTTTAQRTKTTTSVASVPETSSAYVATTETVRPHYPNAPTAHSGFMQSPPVASSPVPYSSPSAYFAASPCLSPSLSSSASSFSTYPPTPVQPSTPASPYPGTSFSTTSACDFYPNVLFDGAPSPVASSPALTSTTWNQQPFYGRYAQPPMQRQQYYAPQKEDVDFWLDVEASLPSIQSAALHAQQQHRDFFNSSFGELEQLLFEHDL